MPRKRGMMGFFSGLGSLCRRCVSLPFCNLLAFASSWEIGTPGASSRGDGIGICAVCALRRKIRAKSRGWVSDIASAPNQRSGSPQFSGVVHSWCRNSAIHDVVFLCSWQELTCSFLLVAQCADVFNGFRREARGAARACRDGFRLQAKIKIQPLCRHSWPSALAVRWLWDCFRLGRVPAPPSRLCKDAPDPTSQGGVGNRNKFFLRSPILISNF